MGVDAKYLEAVNKARRAVPLFTLAELEDIGYAANIDLTSDPEVIVHLLRASADIDLQDTAVRAIQAVPPEEAHKVIVDLLCSADPVEPIPLVAGRALAAVLPDHPLALHQERLGAASHVFDAMIEAGRCRFHPTDGRPINGDVLVLDFDRPLTHWAEGHAATLANGRIEMVLGDRAGIDLQRRVCAPLIVCELTPSKR